MNTRPNALISPWRKRFELDLDILHGCHSGRQSGRTTHMLTLALQYLDFHPTVLVLCRSVEHKKWLKNGAIDIALELGFVIDGWDEDRLWVQNGANLRFEIPGVRTEGITGPTFEDHSIDVPHRVFIIPGWSPSEIVTAPKGA